MKKTYYGRDEKLWFVLIVKVAILQVTETFLEKKKKPKKLLTGTLDCFMSGFNSSYISLKLSLKISEETSNLFFIVIFKVSSKNDLIWSFLYGMVLQL